MSTSPTKNIVIIGGGIIGCSTAYYLSHHPNFGPETKVTIIEASSKGAAKGASGKAGGLIAKWAYPSQLAKLSFAEHVRLAEKYDGKQRWGWRFVECGSWEGRGEHVKKVDPGNRGLSEKKSLEKTVGLGANWKQKDRLDADLPHDLNWVKADLTDSYTPMAPSEDTAQVQPYLFTTALLGFAKEKGVELVAGKVTSINIDGTKGTVTGVTYTDPGGDASMPKTLPASHVVVAAGAWSSHILPSLPLKATRAHSITINPDPTITISPYVLFTEILLPPSPSSKESRPRTVSPEIYPRPNNEVYCCGPGDDSPLPETVDQVKVGEGACESILEHVSSISQVLREGKVDRQQACFLPTVTSGEGPIVGEATKVAKDLYVATGHTCWGICNAPGTAKALAELILEGAVKCADLKKLDPALYL
ncbi:hypothetical protein NLI96_g11052 [Meripilus lineatus]|uniref:FAD dependent oxidoreductase domain-containing protein n=1 Tax=Meripilus lineatus TaxID=2056292 RepID=A0AAD5UST3_9APHY|nr:hypothetical protein NLI96_g11052 [Physisporinus lineatus]